MKDEKKNRKTPGGNAGLIGPIWYIGWLFTIGFAKLSFWKAILALIIWPYYLGSSIPGIG